MREIDPDPYFATLLEEFDSIGGVLDYVFLETDDINPLVQEHRAAALAGMSILDNRLAQRANNFASKEHPLSMFFRLSWDEQKLTGEQIPYSIFWGSDDAAMEPIGDRAWASVDGFKTAFFLTPHGLRGSPRNNEKLFAEINQFVFGTDPERAEIFSWSTNWSNYFDAGNEWWGAFFWTIRPITMKRFVVIGASTSD